MPTEVQPITPAAAKAMQLDTIPPFVVETLNELIVANLSNGSSTVTIPAVAQAIRARLQGQELFAEILAKPSLPSHWLSLENVRAKYAPIGWTVAYDRPDYTESWEAYFKFSEKRN